MLAPDPAITAASRDAVRAADPAPEPPRVRISGVPRGEQALASRTSGSVCKHMNIAATQATSLSREERELLAANLRAARQAMMPGMLVSTARAVGDVDCSLIQLAALFVLADDEALTVKGLAHGIGRSVSATSRMLDQLVAHRLVSRREDGRDRRAKRVSITDEGRAFLHALHDSRAEAQLAVMAYLSSEEQALVAQAMDLLAQAAQRRRADGFQEPTAPRAATATP